MVWRHRSQGFNYNVQRSSYLHHKEKNSHQQKKGFRLPFLLPSSRYYVTGHKGLTAGSKGHVSLKVPPYYCRRNTQPTEDTKIHAFRGIRTFSTSNQEASDLP